jgi:hypothetical protein
MANRAGVEQVLKDALAAVDGAGVPEKLRATAFEKAVDLLSGDSISGGGGGGNGGDGGGGDEVGGDNRQSKIAKRLGVDASKLAYVYDLADDGVSLIVQTSKLPGTKSQATKEIGLLVAAARQAGGYDADSTPSQTIKTAVSDMGKLDEANYAGHLSTQKSWFAMKGTGASREFKVTQPGYEEAAKIVNRIAGGDS